MRKLLLLTVLAVLTVAAPAKAEIINASGGAGGGGHIVLWTMAFDNVADTVTINATHTRFGGLPQLADPQQAQILVDPPTGATLRVNLLTAQVFNNNNGNLVGLFDGDSSSMLNDGDRTRTNFRLRLSQDRASAISFSTLYTPPAQ